MLGCGMVFQKCKLIHYIGDNMNTFGWILKNFFGCNESKYWLIVPKYVSSIKEKKELIKKHTAFMKEKIEIK